MKIVSAATRGLCRVGTATLRAIPPLSRDAVGITGAAAVVYGVWQIHQPSAWIVGGIMAMVVTLRLSLPASSRQREDA